MLKINHLQKLIVIIFSSLLIISCSKKSPDVRLTLCQDLASLMLNSPTEPEWLEHQVIIKGYEDLEMQIKFSLTQKNNQTLNAQASCFYPYEQDDVGAETFQTPTAAYSTYPVKMILDGKVVDKKLLATMVEKAMLAQGKQVIYKAKETINKAKESINKLSQ